MPHYLFRASYTQQGLEGVLKEGGTVRRRAIEELVHSVDGTVESVYWAFGADDFLMIAELADNETAAALAMRVAATGTAAVQTTVLMTALEVDDAVGKHLTYRPPGT